MCIEGSVIISSNLPKLHPFLLSRKKLNNREIFKDSQRFSKAVELQLLQAHSTFVTPHAHARAGGYVIGIGVHLYDLYMYASPFADQRHLAELLRTGENVYVRSSA